MNAGGNRAPRLTRRLLSLSLPAGPLRDSILGDFDEEYRRRAANGVAAARWWFRRHAIDLAARSLTGRVLTRDRYWVSGALRDDAGRGQQARAGTRDPGNAAPPAPVPPRGSGTASVGVAARLDMLAQDLRLGMRQVLRRPGFSALVMLTLAVGIGGNVAIFSVLKGVVLRRLPYPDADRLVAVWETPDEYRNYQPFSDPDYSDAREQATTLEEFGVLSPRWFNLAAEGESARVPGARCSASLLRALGVPPAHGRLFRDDENLEGNEHVVLLSHGFWQRHFGGDTGVVGRSIALDGEPHEVVGIMPEHFEFPTPWGGRDDDEIWAPLVLPSDLGRDSHWLGAIARLADGVTADQAEAELRGIAAQLAQAYPDTNGHTGMWLEPMMRRTLGGISSALMFLLFIVGFVLLIGCANVASMLLARGAGRLPELAVRASLGAGRRRLIGQLLTESLVLSLLGGSAGVLLAYGGVGALRGILPDNVPRVQGIQVDASVLAFAACVTVATGLLFGLAPALFAARTDLAGALKDGRSGGVLGGAGNARPLGVLVAAQLTVGLVLVNAAVVLLVSYANVMQQELNFDTDDVVVAGISLVGPSYGEPHQRRAFWDDLLLRVRALPGVADASITNKLPLVGGSNGGVLVNDQVFDPTSQDNLVEYSFIADRYHEAMGIALLAGRTFDERDLESVAIDAETEGAAVELPLIVNREMAERFWPEEGALGKLVRPDSAEEYFRGRVVGVVENTRQWGAEYRALPEIYFPDTAEVWGASANRLLVIRATGNLEGVEAAVRSALHEIDDRIPLSAPYTMADVLRDSTGRRRFTMMLVSLFAVTALVLIVAGTYGVMSYGVSQRTHEIGVRVALGANRSGVLRLFARRGALMLAPGLVFGIAGTVAATAVTRNMVYGISPLSPFYLLTAAATMVLVSAAAMTVPVVRAMRVDPVEALRAE